MKKRGQEVESNEATSPCTPLRSSFKAFFLARNPTDVLNKIHARWHEQTSIYSTLQVTYIYNVVHFKILNSLDSHGDIFNHAFLKKLKHEGSNKEVTSFCESHVLSLYIHSIDKVPLLINSIDKVPLLINSIDKVSLFIHSIDKVLLLYIVLIKSF